MGSGVSGMGRIALTFMAAAAWSAASVSAQATTDGRPTAVRLASPLSTAPPTPAPVGPGFRGPAAAMVAPGSGAATSDQFLPLALFASLTLIEWDEEVRAWSQSGFAADRLQPVAHAFKHMGDRSTVLVGLSAYLLGEALGKDGLADVGQHASAGLVATGMAVSAIKIGTGRLRPFADGGAEDFDFGRGFARENRSLSFPSGHTATAFAVAATLTEEAKHHWPGQQKWIGPLLYAAATFVGASRMLDDKHWSSDVLMGAAVGTFAGRRTVGAFHGEP
ncbi:MAG: phosphatase PAP2 family protein [Gemmatimonadota bacterium]